MLNIDYTPEQRRSIADDLRRALPLIWTGIGPMRSDQTRFICRAIAIAGVRGEFDPTNLAQRVVRDRLGKAPTLWRWLMSQGIDRRELTNRNVQAHRIAWVKLLIEEFDPQSKEAP